jgi:hypothetical protein
MADAGPDDLPSAPPGVDRDAGSANTIAATIDAAKAAGMAHVLEISQDTLAAGDPIGDLMPMPLPPDRDTSILGGDPETLPGVPPADPQGHGIGDNG